MAALMLEAVTSFCTKHVPVHLALVQIIIFSQEMFTDFKEGLQHQIKKNGSLINSVKGKYPNSSVKSFYNVF